MYLQAAAIGSGPALFVADAASNGSLDPLSLIGTVVTPVLVVVLLLANKLHTDGDYRRVIADLHEERAERVRLQTALTERVIPALTRSTLVLETVSPLLQTEVHLRGVREPGGG